MLLRRWTALAALILVVTTVVFVIQDLRRAFRADESASPLSAGAALLEPVPAAASSPGLSWEAAVGENEFAVLEESAAEDELLQLLADESAGGDDRSPTRIAARPNELPALDSLEPVPLMTEQQRETNLAVIREWLPEATDAELDFWVDETRGMSPEMIADMLRLRSQVGPLADQPPVADELELPTGRAPCIAALERVRGIALRNLANSETVGYKRTDVLLASDSDAAEDAWSGRSLRVADVTLDMTQGPSRTTGRPLDVALLADAFLVVRDAGRTRYTRYGHLRIAADRRLVLDIAGLNLPLDSEIVIPDDVAALQISPRGEIRGTRAGGGGREALGQLPLARFARPERLQVVEHGLLAETSRSGPAERISVSAAESGFVRPGTLEGSNVDWEAERRRVEQIDWLLERLAAE